MADLGDLTRTYPMLLRARVRSDWQYRTSFVVNTLASATLAFVEFIAVLVYFRDVDDLAGWTLGETATLYAMTGASFAIGDAFTSQVERVSRHVKDGTFDRFLLRPVSPYLLLLADEFAFRRLGKLAQAVAVLVVAGAIGPVEWTVVNTGVALVSIASGAAVFAAIWCITSSLAFWTVEAQEVANSFTYGGNFATQYPADIYTGWLRRLLLTVVPLAFVAYLPLAWMLGKERALGIDPAWGLASPLVAAVLVAFARLVWRAGLRRHRSTGS